MPQSDEQQIRTLITDWAAAVHRGEMDGVLADHADDIVMFDMPPPQEELTAQLENRLRLTLGLRKQDGRWTVAHEHHSFADTTENAG